MAKLKGMALEDKVNKVNLRYRKKNQALIVKKSTPLKVTRRGVSYQKSTVDFSGVYKNNLGVSIAIAFDAKECSNGTSFPLANIEEHQLQFLQLWQICGGESFIYLYLIKLDKYYKIPIDFIINFISTNTRKSIPFKELRVEWEVDGEDYLCLN